MLGRSSLTSNGRVHSRVVLILALFGVSIATVSRPAYAGSSMEERKLPMRFTWHDGRPTDCSTDCRGWVSAIGVVDADSVKAFEDLARDHDLRGVTVVLDSGGGSVLDAITLGRRFRTLEMSTAVGTAVKMPPSAGVPAHTGIVPNAYCESMCVFLLLSGVHRYAPPEARVRVHQIWMGDRAEDARAANYSADDVTIIERDIGRLAHYTFDMGGSGELLGMALSVPPWDPLRELSDGELRRTNVVNTDLLSDVLPGAIVAPLPAVALSVPKSQARVTVETSRTAEAKAPTGGASLDVEVKK